MDNSYDVCLSFAGEDRQYVQQVAEHLRSLNVTVFYDKYEQVNLWGKDLYQHLSDTYRKKARYCVIFISAAYATKLWTRHELKAAQARAFTENSEYILPARFDDTELPGIHPTIGYIDLVSLAPQDLASLISAKVQCTINNTQTLETMHNIGSINKSVKGQDETPGSNSFLVVKCARCAGTGTRDRDGRDPRCPVCDGGGKIRVRKQGGRFTTCAFCKGDGTRDRDGRDPVCPVCKGLGGYFIEEASMPCARCAETGSRDRDGREPLCEFCSGRGYISACDLKEW